MTQTPLRSMSAARNQRPSGDRRTSWGIALAPAARFIRGPPIWWAIAGEVAPGVAIPLRSTTLTRWVASASTTISCPLNSQLATSVVRSALKSAWLIPSTRQGQGADERHRGRVPNDDRLEPFGHHQGVPSVRGEVQVVRVGDRDRGLRLTGRRVDGGHRVTGVAVDPQRAQVVGRHHMLRGAADPEPGHHCVGGGVDDLHGARHLARHVNQVPGGQRRAGQVVRPGMRIRCGRRARTRYRRRIGGRRAGRGRGRVRRCGRRRLGRLRHRGRSGRGGCRCRRRGSRRAAGRPRPLARTA